MSLTPPPAAPVRKGDICLFLSSSGLRFLLEKSNEAVYNHMFIVNKSDKQVNLKERKVRQPLPWSPPHPVSRPPSAWCVSPAFLSPVPLVLLCWPRGAVRAEFHFEKQVPTVP